MVSHEGKISNLIKVNEIICIISFMTNEKSPYSQLRKLEQG
jgi:hypothetical protein